LPHHSHAGVKCIIKNNHIMTGSGFRHLLDIYEALVSRYEETERRRDELADRINQIMIRRRKLERFIETVEGLPELYTEFDAGQWAALVDSMTVHAKDRITFTLTYGMEIEE